MPWFNTGTLTQTSVLDAIEREQIYNGLDSCITLEIHNKLVEEYPNPPISYTFARALQAPAMEMMLRGIKVDETERREAIIKLQHRMAEMQSQLNRMAKAVWGTELNPRSPIQLQQFFYKFMRIPKIWSSKKGKAKLSMDRETLEKLEQYFHTQPFVSTILRYRELAKQLETLQTEIDLDGRIRTSYNIAGTETGRWSSSANAFGTGGNLQNWENQLRSVLIADKGKIIVGIDLEQAESREVGFQCGLLFDDWSYLDACYAGDLHTLVCKGVWPDLAAQEDLTDDSGAVLAPRGLKFGQGSKKADRAIAEQPFYRHFTYRDMSKRGGHGSNYYGTPFTMARHLKVPVRFMQTFQTGYFTKFPGIPAWHDETRRRLQTTQKLTTPWGRTRHFFGRTNDDATLREAIAFVPQSSTADRMNLGLYRLWKHMGKEIELLAQIHDAVYFQCLPSQLSEVIPRALNLLDLRLHCKGHELIVPGEAKTGWNLANYNNDPTKGPLNLNGLAKWKGEEKRTRIEGLDRRFS